MVNTAPQTITTDTWVRGNWQEFLALAASATDDQARFYSYS